MRPLSAAPMVGAAFLGLAVASPAGAQSKPEIAPAHAKAILTPPHRSSAPPVRRDTARAATLRAPHPARKTSQLMAAVRSPVRVPPRPTAKPKGVLALAGCYGRFIGWRDQLAALMLQANSYTPWPDDKVRFDRVERAFAAGVLRERKLVLTLQPSFKEADFPEDVREAFRAGVAKSAGRFADGDYQRTQILVIGQPDLSAQERMAQLEANADQAFAPLAAPCERRSPG